MPKIWDVIVVGAGPAGSECARLLARRGYEVVLLERDARPGASANCTGIVGQEAFAEFGIPRELVVREIEALEFVGPMGRTLRFAPSGVLASVVRRRHLDSYLADRARQAGVRLRTGWSVIRALRHPSHVEIECRRAASEGRVKVARRVLARAVVLAIGYRPPLMRSLGLEAPTSVVNGVQLLCPLTSVAPDQHKPGELEVVPILWTGIGHS